MNYKLIIKLIALACALLFIGSIGGVAVSTQNSANAAPALRQAAVVAATTLPPTQLTITTQSQTPKVNTAFTVWGSLQTGLTGRSGYNIYLYRYTYSTGQQKLLGTYKTDSNGYYHAYSLTLPSAGKYLFWASLADTTTLRHSASGYMVMQAWTSTPPVQKPSNAILYASNQNPPFNEVFAIGGYLQSGQTSLTGQRVFVYYQHKKSLNDPWGTTYGWGYHTAASNGNWEAPFVAKSYDYYRFWATFAGGGGYLDSQSNIVELKPSVPKVDTSLYIGAQPSKPQWNDFYIISVLLNDVNGHPLLYRNIKLYEYDSVVGTWISRSGTTDSKGHCAWNLVKSSPRTMRYYAVYNGDSTHKAAQSQTLSAPITERAATITFNAVEFLGPKWKLYGYLKDAKTGQGLASKQIDFRRFWIHYELDGWHSDYRSARGTITTTTGYYTHTQATNSEDYFDYTYSWYALFQGDALYWPAYARKQVG